MVYELLILCGITKFM